MPTTTELDTKKVEKMFNMSSAHSIEYDATVTSSLFKADPLILTAEQVADILRSNYGEANG